MMNCPHCQTEIDEHEAGRCLRGWVAESVMGWRVENGEDGLPAHAFPSKDEHVYLLPDLGPQWYPDHDIAAAWEMVEKLGEDVTHDIGVSYNGFQWFCEWGVQGQMHIETAPTAPLAICRAALKAVYVGG